MVSRPHGDPLYFKDFYKQLPNDLRGRIYGLWADNSIEARRRRYSFWQSPRDSTIRPTTRTLNVDLSQLGLGAGPRRTIQKKRTTANFFGF